MCGVGIVRGVVWVWCGCGRVCGVCVVQDVVCRTSTTTGVSLVSMHTHTAVPLACSSRTTEAGFSPCKMNREESLIHNSLYCMNTLYLLSLSVVYLQSLISYHFAS